MIKIDVTKNHHFYPEWINNKDALSYQDLQTLKNLKIDCSYIKEVNCNDDCYYLRTSTSIIYPFSNTSFYVRTINDKDSPDYILEQCTIKQLISFIEEQEKSHCLTVEQVIKMLKQQPKDSLIYSTNTESYVSKKDLAIKNDEENNRIIIGIL